MNKFVEFQSIQIYKFCIPFSIATCVLQAHVDKREAPVDDYHITFLQLKENILTRRNIHTHSVTVGFFMRDSHKYKVVFFEVFHAYWNLKNRDIFSVMLSFQSYTRFCVLSSLSPWTPRGLTFSI